mmetsp:Transcript_37727/g.53210  ORF Transcript_37727/g.53210 Transcript_37727/m.53210 type:complete len:128 (-) Transcript_37727:265-648(-)
MAVQTTTTTIMMMIMNNNLLVQEEVVEDPTKTCPSKTTYYAAALQASLICCDENPLDASAQPFAAMLLSVQAPLNCHCTPSLGQAANEIRGNDDTSVEISKNGLMMFFWQLLQYCERIVEGHLPYYS